MPCIPALKPSWESEFYHSFEFQSNNTWLGLFPGDMVQQVQKINKMKNGKGKRLFFPERSCKRSLFLSVIRYFTGYLDNICKVSHNFDCLLETVFIVLIPLIKVGYKDLYWPRCSLSEKSFSCSKEIRHWITFKWFKLVPTFVRYAQVNW